MHPTGSLAAQTRCRERAPAWPRVASRPASRRSEFRRRSWRPRVTGCRIELLEWRHRDRDSPRRRIRDCHSHVASSSRRCCALSKFRSSSARSGSETEPAASDDCRPEASRKEYRGTRRRRPPGCPALVRTTLSSRCSCRSSVASRWPFWARRKRCRWWWWRWARSAPLPLSCNFKCD